MGIFNFFGDKAEAKPGKQMVTNTPELSSQEKELRHQKMYCFAHIAIRDAVMQNHPELMHTLEKPQDHSMFPMLHFWSKASLIMEEAGLVEIEDEFDSDNDDYWTPFSEMKVEQFFDKGHRVSVITFPEPLKSPGAWMTAIVHKEGDSYEYDGSRGTARYFALEYTGYPGPGVFCEWNDEEHINYDVMVDINSNEFAEMVLRYL